MEATVKLIHSTQTHTSTHTHTHTHTHMYLFYYCAGGSLGGHSQIDAHHTQTHTGTHIYVYLILILCRWKPWRPQSK